MDSAGSAPLQSWATFRNWNGRWEMRRRIGVGVVVLLSIVAGNAGGGVQYTVTDLGVLPGDSSSNALGINASGEVVGSCYNLNTGYLHAFLYSNGTMTDLRTLGGTSSEASGINASGEVVGWSSTTSSHLGHAFLYTNGTMTDLGTLSGGSWSSADAINSQGQVVGDAYTSSGAEHAFLYSNGTMTDLGTLPGYSYSWATGINSSGQVVGWAYNMTSPSTISAGQAFLYSNGTMTVLGTSGIQCEATGINDSGQVVGWAEHTGGYCHAFLYSNGTMTDLGVIAPDLNSYATAINASGQVVTAVDPANLDMPLSTQPFLYRNGTITDLNSLIPGWSLKQGDGATAINDAGQIVGYGANPTGQTDAFLLAPAIPGDANLDRRVDINDLTIVLSNFGQSGMTWSQGEFNGDGTVDINDLTSVLANFGYGVTSGGVQAVPEPSSRMLTAGSLGGLLAFARRRRAQFVSVAKEAFAILLCRP